MYDYVWVLHIHSEVTKAFSESDLANLSLSGMRSFSSSSTSKDQVVMITCSDISDVHNLVFNVDHGQSTEKVSVDVMSSGLCRMNIESENDLDDAARSDIIIAVSSMIASFICGTSQGKEDDIVCGTTDLSGIYGPITAENDHEAVMQLFDSMIISCRTNVNDIMKSEDDYITLFGRIGTLIKNVSNAELFVSSVKSIVPDEYDGMWRP